MSNQKYEFLPEVNCEITDKDDEVFEVIADSPCPCCGKITIPNHGDALGYICPVCMWEIDLFIKDENEASDSNHGLTLIEARERYRLYGIVDNR